MTTHDDAATAVDENITGLVAVGRPAIANPDLVTPRQKSADEKEVDQASLYGCGENRYTDYPFSQD